VSDPYPNAVTGHHLPALGGLRAMAVLGVMAYHLQFGWASGGYLGVDLFFVLSGFLITTLLLEEWAGTGRLNLASFWARRARRLLPALFLVVVGLALYVILNAQFGGSGANGLIDLSSLRGDAIATLLYIGNWHAIYAHQSYFAQFSSPSPLQHTWSLAIEEQFYLVWPPVLLVVLRSARRSWRQMGLLVAVVVALISAILMALLFHPGGDPTRIYYGTDTRAFDLMTGAVLAFLVAARPQPNERAQRTLHVAAPLAAALLAVFWVVSGTAQSLPRNYMFDGGFLLCAVLAAIRQRRFRSAWRIWLAPLAAVATAAALVIATIPAVADPSAVATTSHTTTPVGQAVAGSGGYQSETPIALGTTVSPADPLRVVVLGDSVMHDAYFGINAALGSTGEVDVMPNTIDGFGLTTSTDWPTSLPTIIRNEHPQLIIATWSWDQDGPTKPNALRQPAAYTALLQRAIKVMLTPGNGVKGIIFTQFPVVGNILATDLSQQKAYNKARAEGTTAWNDIAAKMATDFPGRVMYLPLGSSLLLNGQFSSWLPPQGQPSAPLSEWTRIRKLDNVHLCPEGAARYADALLTDLTAVFHLSPASNDWANGTWTSDPDFNDPAGACPDDHPPPGTTSS
jgi:peptidoglycan/LPS O-acetylase OafA/YrhL